MVNQKIYVRMENDEVCMKFYEWAEHEGYTFGGEKPRLNRSAPRQSTLLCKYIRKNRRAFRR